MLITDEVENYPGFPEEVKGPLLAQDMETQALLVGGEWEYAEVECLDDIDKPLKVVRTDGKNYTAKSNIIATGGAHHKLGVPGEDEITGRGVSYCAVCDGNFFRGQDVVVMGGGDSAVDEGIYLLR